MRKRMLKREEYVLPRMYDWTERQPIRKLKQMAVRLYKWAQITGKTLSCLYFQLKYNIHNSALMYILKLIVPNLGGFANFRIRNRSYLVTVKLVTLTLTRLNQFLVPYGKVSEHYKIVPCYLTPPVAP